MSTLSVGEYLSASGSAAICIVPTLRGYSFVVSRNVPPAASAHWVEQTLAVKIARLARRNAGRYPDKATAERALQSAASSHGARLTPNIIAVSRATFAAKKLQGSLDAMNKSGGLAEFNREFKRRRIAATMRGEGFMSFANATLRLRKALIMRLVNKEKFGNTAGFFDEVFGNKI